MSGSMSVGPKIALARQAFSSLLSQLRDGRDELAVFTFDSAFHERQAFTTSIAGLTNVLTISGRSDPRRSTTPPP